MRRLRIRSRSSKNKSLDLGKLGSKMGRRIGRQLGRRVGSLMGRELGKKYLPTITRRLAGTLFPGFPLENLLFQLFKTAKSKPKPR